jgi:hypothetical protein
MTHSDGLDKIFAALAAAQGEIKAATRNADNPFFHSRYADLAAIQSACRGPLAAHGLSVIQIPSSSGATASVRTILCHESGQWISGDPITATAMRQRRDGRPDDDTGRPDPGPQAIVALVTYLRRCALAAFVGVAPGDDDDGEMAEGRGGRMEEEPKKPRERQTVEHPAKMDGQHASAVRALAISITERVGITERPAKLAWVNEQLRRMGSSKVIASTNDLSVAECRKLIDVANSMDTPRAL